MKENINLSDYKKRIFLNNVIETIEVDYNEKEYLHHLRINFRLPVMRSIKELKTDVKLSTSALFKKPKPQLREGDQTCSVHDYSTVTPPIFSDTRNPNILEPSDIYLLFSVDYFSGSLIDRVYTPHQQFLFDTISRLYDVEGLTYKQISDWMNQHNHKTPRGHIFTHKHAWSIHMKKKRAINRSEHKVETVISDLSVGLGHSIA